ncbi:MAG: hypothetical protein U0572_15515 [Phycisphaerales bacterium]
MQTNPTSRFLIASVLAAAVASVAFSGVKLIALPKRERVEIQLDVPGLTLVQEERTIPLAQGVNEVVFAWANTAIDKSTIQFRCVSDPEKVQVISVSYPPNENSLTWRVGSPTAGPAKVRISYVIGGVDKSYEYRAEAAKDEKTLELQQYVELHNRTPESFGESDMFAGYGERLERPIGANETRKILAARFEGVPVTKTYTADLAQFGYLDPAKRQLKIPMHYLLKNDATHGLGKFPLPAGKARIFQDDGHGSSAFLGEDWSAFAAKDDELKLYLGVAKDIVVTRTIEKRDRRQTAGPLSDYDIVVKYEIENFKDQPVSIDLAESISALHRETIGDVQRPIEWVLGSTGSLKEMDNTKSTNDRVLFRVEAPPRGADQKAVKKTETLNVVMKNEWAGVPQP